MWLLAQGRSAGSAQILQELEEELTCRRRDCSSQHDPLQTISRTASAPECNLIFARISVRQYQGMRWLNWDPHVSDEIYDRTVQFIDSWMAPRYRSCRSPRMDEIPSLGRVQAAVPSSHARPVRNLSGSSSTSRVGVTWSVHLQEGPPFGDGVVSGMAMTMSSSPAVATIARVRKAAL